MPRNTVPCPPGAQIARGAARRARTIAHPTPTEHHVFQAHAGRVRQGPSVPAMVKPQAVQLDIMPTSLARPVALSAWDAVQAVTPSLQHPPYARYAKRAHTRGTRFRM